MQIMLIELLYFIIYLIIKFNYQYSKINPFKNLIQLYILNIHSTYVLMKTNTIRL